MASKYGRPQLGESDNTVVNNEREKARKRIQRIRSERKQQTTVAARPTAGQLHQGELMINLGSIEEEIAVQTLAQVGREREYRRPDNSSWRRRSANGKLFRR
jgi:hypothetical protein